MPILLFSVGNYSCLFVCGEETNAHWTSRCSRLNYDEDRKTFADYFVVTDAESAHDENKPDV